MVDIDPTSLQRPKQVYHHVTMTIHTSRCIGYDAGKGEMTPLSDPRHCFSPLSNICHEQVDIMTRILRYDKVTADFADA
jgi:hypothetical protein